MQNEFSNVECCACDSREGRPNVPELESLSLFVCEDCARPFPGKFEGNANRVLAVALYSLSLDASCLDESCGDTQFQGWTGRIGRFLVFEDSVGFFSYAEFEDEDAARAEFARIDAEDARETADSL